MKTLTEFAAPTLKNAHAKKQELTTAGKTAEELPAALGEALTLEGDKLAFLLAALDTVGEKMADLKRVVVSQLAEGEKAPSGARLVGEKYYTVEYYVPMHRGGAEKHDDRDSRGGRRDGKGKRGGKPGERGGKPGERGGKPGERGGKPGERGGDRGSRGPKPAQFGGGTGKLPVPNKTGGGGLPVPNKTAAQPEPKAQSGDGDSARATETA